MQNFEEVYEVARLIPEGRVTSYGAIAKYLGTGARLVGWAMNASHLKNVPAHRVVNHAGVLTGKNHFATPTLMQELLENEGIIIIKDKIQNFKDLFWDPETELSL
ncbi:MAG: MGMT family protein [Spirosomataceae bacterium]|jgi:methylated-DNA-protein-cysteine methyltransferase-like protein|nr:MGMT family protein [Bacteroidota bacterium]